MTEQKKAIEHLYDIDRTGEGLTQWEMEFVADLIDNWIRKGKRLSDKQIARIYTIYKKRC